MPLDVGDSLPRLTLLDQDGQSVSTTDWVGQRTILFFYPRAFTPGCTGEACDFRDSETALSAAGYTVIGVSPDDVDLLARFKAENALPYTLLSDPDHALAEAMGAWGMKKNYGREYEGLIRSTFVIDGEGVVERVYRNVRAKGHVARVQRDLGAA